MPPLVEHDREIVLDPVRPGWTIEPLMRAGKRDIHRPVAIKIIDDIAAIIHAVIAI